MFIHLSLMLCNLLTIVLNRREIAANGLQLIKCDQLLKYLNALQSYFIYKRCTYYIAKYIKADLLFNTSIIELARWPIIVYLCTVFIFNTFCIVCLKVLTYRHYIVCFSQYCEQPKSFVEPAAKKLQQIWLTFKRMFIRN